MSKEFLEKMRSINFGNPQKRKSQVTETVTDTAVGYTTEHWDDRVDVRVEPKTIRLGYQKER